MPRATTSSSASARSQGRATSCRHCARDDRTNRNRCNCRCVPAASSPRLFAREKLFRAAAHHRAGLASQLREDVAGSRASFATPGARARETCLVNLPKRLFVPEILASGNDRTLPTRKDRQSDRQWRLPRAVSPVLVERHRKEDFGWENANWL